MSQEPSGKLCKSAWILSARVLCGSLVMRLDRIRLAGLCDGGVDSSVGLALLWRCPPLIDF